MKVNIIRIFSTDLTAIYLDGYFFIESSKKAYFTITILSIKKGAVVPFIIKLIPTIE